MTDHDDQSDAQVPFGRWLLTQRDRSDWVDGIADAARADRTFPKNGDHRETVELSADRQELQPYRGALHPARPSITVLCRDCERCSGPVGSVLEKIPNG